MPTTTHHDPANPHRFQKSLSLLRKSLSDEERKVLNSLLSHTTLSFPNINTPPPTNTTPSNHQETLYLGLRPLSDPKKFAQEYATLHSSTTTPENEPPLITYHEREFSVPTSSHQLQPPFQTKTTFYKRTSTSLLRRPHLLDPPFCFLYFDPSSKTERREVKLILIALILYYFAVSGRSSAAFVWKGFKGCLRLALRGLAERRDWWAWVEGQTRRRRGEGGRLNEVARLVVPGEEEEEVEVLVDVDVDEEGERDDGRREGEGGDQGDQSEDVERMDEMEFMNMMTEILAVHEHDDGDSSGDYVDD
ncbi:hypothetical protein DM02DRAFT_626179 [Periconia macrospinosa]|uniref:Uncharacterized protein n=1 Tax=Periconia macrospinosa TaxID=97972 RepID=A0A2V1DYM4_9PLEO|nr:hypothetical protein DM02DRAFT_626179 [Periconia macrospinosa]